MSETKESSCWILDFVSPFFSGHAHSAAGRQWTLMMPFVRALLGNLSSGCRWVKAVHSFLGFVLEALQREAESRLSLADLELAWGFVSSSVLEPHPTSFVRSPWTHLTAALLLWGIHAVCLLLKSAKRRYGLHPSRALPSLSCLPCFLEYVRSRAL